MVERTALMKRVRRVVLKIGTQVLTTDHNRLDTSVIEHLVAQTAALVREKREAVIVTSGAITAGVQVLGWEERPTQLNLMQAAASVGQSRMMRVYERLFREEGINVGQVLLTADIFTRSERTENVKRTLTALLACGVVPVINENDAVAVDELRDERGNVTSDGSRFGDNDRLSSLVAVLMDADLLLMLSDVDGLYDGDPKHGDARLIPEVRAVHGGILEIGRRGRPSRHGTGGMKTKIDAARHVTEHGKLCLIANGKESWIIRRVFAGEPAGTLFLPGEAA